MPTEPGVSPIKSSYRLSHGENAKVKRPGQIIEPGSSPDGDLVFL